MLNPIIFAFLLSFNESAPRVDAPQVTFQDYKLRNDVAMDSAVTVLAHGMQWAEGPVWVSDGNFLLFSDPALNIIYRWDEHDGLTEFLKPSGYQGTDHYSDEPGTNGLLINQDGDLIACDHGNRRIAKINLKSHERETLVDRWEGKRFNSPNDICQHPNGDYYFTDPPYGLPDREQDSIHREIQENGVYRLSASGEIEQIISDLDRPNGIALAPDARSIYVALSDGNNPYIMRYQLKDGQVNGPGKILFDFKKRFPDASLAADGIKVDSVGNLYAAAGDGIIIISPSGEPLGRIQIGHPTANCAFSDDGYLYITASKYLLRIRVADIGSLLFRDVSPTVGVRQFHKPYR